VDGCVTVRADADAAEGPELEWSWKGDALAHSVYIGKMDHRHILSRCGGHLMFCLDQHQQVSV
jgi:hypothetical protein